jgi:hypothetical protein
VFVFIIWLLAFVEAALLGHLALLGREKGFSLLPCVSLPLLFGFLVLDGNLLLVQ